MNATTGHSSGNLWLRAMRKHPLVLVVALAAAAAAAYLSLERRDQSYEATAELLVSPVSRDNSTFSGLPVIRDAGDPTRTMQTAAALVETPAAARRAATQLGGDWTPGAVLDAVAVQPLGESNVLAVVATAPEPETAAAVAGRFSRAVLAVRASTLLRGIDERLEDLARQQRERTGEDGAVDWRLAEVAVELRSLRGGRRDPSIELIREADAASPIGSSSALVIGLAIVAGLVLGTLAAVGLELTNRRVRSEDELIEAYPLPVLSRIPRFSGSRRRSASAAPGDVPPMVREAYRTLALQLSSASAEGQVIIVTSASAGDGKTTVSAGLAMALGGSGRSVVAIDADLRRPTLSRALGVAATTKTALLPAGHVDLEDGLVTCPDTPEVRVLPAVPQDAAFLESSLRHLPDLIREAAEIADYVIVDTPPLGEVGDALRLLGTAGDVLLVARPGHTLRGRFASTRDLLERAGARPAGLVLVGQDVGGASGYYAYAPRPEARLLKR